jgi:hypothetical protein
MRDSAWVTAMGRSKHKGLPPAKVADGLGLNPLVNGTLLRTHNMMDDVIWTLQLAPAVFGSIYVWIYVVNRPKCAII